VLDTGPGLVNQAPNTLSSSASWEYRQRSGEGRRKEPAPTVTGAALQEQVRARALKRETFCCRVFHPPNAWRWSGSCIACPGISAATAPEDREFFERIDNPIQA
jgi:hypothetical protein